MAKTQAAERVNAASFFIKASGEADAVGEGEAHAFDGLTGRCLGGDQAEEAKLFQPAQAAQGDVMGELRIEAEEEVAGELVLMAGHR